MPEFVPGLELARAFYDEAVAPLLGGTEHVAALLPRVATVYERWSGAIES